MERAYKMAVGVYFAALLAFNAPRIIDPYICLGGMVNWIGPMRAVVEASGSEADRSHFRREGGIRNSVLGYNLLLRFIRWTGEPVRLAKAYSWGLILVGVIFLFRLARDIAGPAAGLVACVLFLHMPAHRDVMGGIPTTFSWPLLLAFLYYLRQQRHRAVLVCIGLCGLFYPPLVPGCAALYVLRRVRRDPDSGRPGLWLRDRRLWALGALLLGLFVLVVPWSMIFKEQARPELASYTERLARDAALENQLALIPEEGTGNEDYHWIQRHWAGHFVAAMGQPLQVRGFTVWGTEVPFSWRARYGPGLLLLAFLALLAWVGVRRAAAPRLVTELLLSSSALYLLAMLVAFWLYYPERYVEHTLPVASILLMSVVVARAVERLPKLARGAVPVVLCLAYLAGWGSGVDTGLGPEDDFRDAREVLGYLKGIPPRSTVASPLYLGDAVELFSDRESFLFCQEVTSLSHLLSGHDYRAMIGRMTALHQAYYARDAAAVLAFMRRFDVTYMLGRRAHFEPGFMNDPASRLCPHEIAAARKASAAGKAPAFLAAAPASVKVYSDDKGFFVITRSKLEAYLNKPGRR